MVGISLGGNRAQKIFKKFISGERLSVPKNTLLNQYRQSGH